MHTASIVVWLSALGEVVRAAPSPPNASTHTHEASDGTAQYAWLIALVALLAYATLVALTLPMTRLRVPILALVAFALFPPLFFALLLYALILTTLAVPPVAVVPVAVDVGHESDRGAVGRAERMRVGEPA